MRPKPLPRTLGIPRIPLALALRRRPRLRRALAVGVAVLTGLVVQRTVADAETARQAWGRGAPVAIAVRDLQPGHVVGAGDIRMVSLPAAAAPAEALDRVPRGRVVRSLVLRGEVLHRRRLAPAGRGGPAALLPPGTRAVAIPIDAGSTPPLRRGDTVDLMAVAAGTDGGPRAGVLAFAATVVDVGERSVTVALDAETVPRVVAALGAGAVVLTLVAP